MFNAEMLLGKILTNTLQPSRRRRPSRSNDLIGNLLGELTSGKGLLTLAGLGVGAYEILKEQSHSRTSTAPPHVPSSETSFTSRQNRSTVASPPPLPTQIHTPPPLPASEKRKSSILSQNPHDLSIRFIQTMIAAAHADGLLDKEEKEKIVNKMQNGPELDEEEKDFLFRQLDHPCSINELTTGIDDPAIAQIMYTLAVSAITVDTEAERKWLNNFAEALSISPTLQGFIEG